MKGVYLSFPIDQNPTPERLNVISIIQTWLTQQDEVSWVYSPGAAFRAGKAGITSGIRDINMTALMSADILIAFLPAGIPTIGVPMEIERAASVGKQVLVVSDAPSWMLEYGWENVSVYSSWGAEAQDTLSAALRGPSRGLVAPPRAPLPVAISEAGERPRRGYDDDAGLDLFVSQTVVLQPGEFTDIPCDISLELPDWSWGMIVGRSSTLRSRGLLVNLGVIDAGYRGPIFAGAWNLTDEEVKVEKGERIAQLIVMVNGTRNVEPMVVDELNPGSRGPAGFGSTGT